MTKYTAIFSSTVEVTILRALSPAFAPDIGNTENDLTASLVQHCLSLLEKTGFISHFVHEVKDAGL